MRVWGLIAGLLIAPLAASAEGFCDVEDATAVLAQIHGDWTREGAMSLDNEVTAQIRPSAGYVVNLNDTGVVTSMFIDSLIGQAAQATLANPRPYDVDRVDDVLDTTERADLADILSDTKCGPGQLPQFVVTLSENHELNVTGTITYIVYFDDRLLEITELTLKSDETVLFMTETALLRPQDPKAE